MITCVNCKYYEALKNETGEATEFGVCFALPPSLLMVTGLIESGIQNGIQSVHPQVSEKRKPCIYFAEIGGYKSLS